MVRESNKKDRRVRDIEIRL